MNAAPAASRAESTAPRAGWSRQRWIFWITLVLAAHVALIFIFGIKKPVQPRAVTNVPQLQLADPADELIALDNPTLFALPNAHDFATALWLQTPPNPSPSFRYPEPAGWLALATENLGATFSDFMQTNGSTKIPLDFKPKPLWMEPAVPWESALPKHSRLQLTGELAHRRLLQPVAVPSWPCNDVIAPSRVQVLVTPAGDVSSAVLLPQGNPLDHDATADQQALALACTLRFVPAPDLMLGELIFHWHTVPLTPTNAP